MHNFEKFMRPVLSTLIILLKLLLALFLLGIAKVTLRTNPALAIAVLGTALLIFLIWFFSPQIKQFLFDLRADD